MLHSLKWKHFSGAIENVNVNKIVTIKTENKDE